MSAWACACLLGPSSVLWNGLLSPGPLCSLALPVLCADRGNEMGLNRGHLPSPQCPVHGGCTRGTMPAACGCCWTSLSRFPARLWKVRTACDFPEKPLASIYIHIPGKREPCHHAPSYPAVLLSSRLCFLLAAFPVEKWIHL